MLRIEPKWGEDAQSLLEKSTEARDRHMRKRLLALSFVASGDTLAVAAGKLGINRAAVSRWVHLFNKAGIEGLKSRWKGSPGKRLTPEELSQLKNAIRSHPSEAGITREKWTREAVAEFVEMKFGRNIHPDTARNYLLELGFRHRKPDHPNEEEAFRDQGTVVREIRTIVKRRINGGETTCVQQGSIERYASAREGWVLQEPEHGNEQRVSSVPSKGCP